MSRSLRVRADLVPRVELAVRRNGFLRKKDLAEALGMAESTVRKFRRGKPVDYAIFVEICQKLNLEWQDFADFGEITELNRESEEAVSEEAIAKPQRESEQPDASSIEDRIFRATEQLNRRGFSALVGIQALEEIAKDSPRYHWKIMELLAAFIRNAPRSKEEEGIPDDIQAALTVIGRRNPDNDKKSLNLRNTNLRGANLFGADLRGAYLNGADLREVCLTTANLKGAVLWEANLEGAKLDSANLEEAKLSKTNLQSANFSCSILRRADLSEAKLQEADLSGTDLRKADLTGANLERAYLYKANLQEASLMRAMGQRADLRRVYLQGTNLSGADFSRAKNLKLDQLKLASGDSTTSLPDELKDFKEDILTHWEQSGS